VTHGTGGRRATGRRPGPAAAGANAHFNGDGLTDLAVGAPGDDVGAALDL
jgi:FG-GAP repeat